MNNKINIWKGYFIAYMLITILGYVYIIYSKEIDPVMDTIDFICFLILATALYGYIYKKVILTALTWKILKYFYLFIFVLSLSSYNELSTENIIIVLVTIMLLAPAIIALFKYTSFMETQKSNE